MKLIIRYIFIAALLVTASCSSKKLSKEGVSVFDYTSQLKVDQSLSNLKIKIPKSQKNKFWFGSNSDNANFFSKSSAKFSGNFAFDDKINNIKSLWSGFRTKYYNRAVFAPIIAEDKIFLLDDKGNLIARNISDYKRIWKVKIIDKKQVYDFTMGKISYRSGIIFAITGYNLVVAIRAETGEILWSKTLGSIPISTPISDGNQIYVSTNDNKTYALDVKNGNIIWVHSAILRNTGILGAANPVIYKDYVLASYSSGEIYVLDRKKGVVEWTYSLNSNRAVNSDFILNDIDATPIVQNSVVYVVGNGGKMMAIKVSNGLILWEKSLASISDFWIAGNFIYLTNNDNKLIAMRKSDGAIKWMVDLKKYRDPKKTTSKIIYNGLIMAGGNLVLTNSNREIVLISPIDGKIVQTKSLSQKVYHGPVIANGKIYLQTIGRFSVNLLVID